MNTPGEHSESAEDDGAQGLLAPGTIFEERYEIIRLLGRGGFASVYLAEQTNIERNVAVKVLNLEALGSTNSEDRVAATVKRFEREAKLISRLQNWHTVQLHDFGHSEDRNLLYMIMEFVDGLTLSEFVRRHGPMEPARAVEVLRQTLIALREAHGLGMLHRDIKPQNIMIYDHVDQPNQVKLLDFGIAKAVSGSSSRSDSTELTSDGALVGTPRYMSPEQIRAEELGPETDIYSLGLVIYELLAGSPAVDVDSSVQIIGRHLDHRPFTFDEEVSLPAGLRRIVERMVAKQRARRFQSAADVLEALETWESTGAADLPLLPVSESRAALVDEAPTVVGDLVPIDEDGDDLPDSAPPRRRMGVGVLVLALALVASASAWLLSRPDEVPAEPPTQAVAPAHASEGANGEEAAPKANVAAPTPAESPASRLAAMKVREAVAMSKGVAAGVSQRRPEPTETAQPRRKKPAKPPKVDKSRGGEKPKSDGNLRLVPLDRVK